MSNTEMLIRLVVAAALGSLIGFERERLLWAAGIRTHMLVCVGSCLIMIVSQYGFSNILTHQNIVLDPSRIAARLFRELDSSVQGRSSPGGKHWTAAAVGLAVGGGLYLAASASGDNDKVFADQTSTREAYHSCYPIPTGCHFAKDP